MRAKSTATTARPWVRWLGTVLRLAVLAILLAAALAMAGAAPASAWQGLPAGVHPVGSVQPVSAANMPEWHAVLTRHRKTDARAPADCRRGAAEACTLEAWQRFLDRIGDQPLWEQLRHVNIAVNRRPYVEDMETWGVQDHWAAPQDFFARGGDCEDYAIAKYLSLRSLGVRASDLLLASVFDSARNVEHLVLLVLLPGGAVMLDNESDFVVPWDPAGPYRPLYLLNEERIFLAAAAE